MGYLDYMVNVIGPRDQYRKNLWSDGKSDEETDLKLLNLMEELIMILVSFLNVLFRCFLMIK